MPITLKEIKDSIQENKLTWDRELTDDNLEFFFNFLDNNDPRH